MAVLTDPDRFALQKAWCEQVSRNRGALNLTRANLRAAINAIDDWVDANSTSFNQAIPQPARSALTAQQKAELLMFVVTRRFEVS